MREESDPETVVKIRAFLVELAMVSFLFFIFLGFRFIGFRFRFRKEKK